MEGSAPSWWQDLPVDGAVNLIGADLDYLERSLDPLPAEAPATVFMAEVHGSAQAIITEVIARLDGALVTAYPSWLPGAEAIDSHGPIAREAVRSLAVQQAQRIRADASVLADLAERALAGVATPRELIEEIRLPVLVFRVLGSVMSASR